MADFLRLVPREPDYDILADLRALIAQYESGERTKPAAFVFVAEDDEGLSHGAFGLLDTIHAIGMHTLAAQLLGHEAV